MLKTNKIITKSLLPGLLLATSFSVATVGACAFAAKKSAQINGRVTNRDYRLITLIALVLFFIIFNTCNNTCNKYKKAEKFSMLVAKRYIKKASKDFPDLKDFDEVLTNPNAMRNIATIISNQLHSSEQKLIRDIVSDATIKWKKYEKNKTLTESQLFFISKKICAKACADIAQVLNEHASVHPEFLSNIYKFMAYADTMYVVQNPIQQHTR